MSGEAQQRLDYADAEESVELFETVRSSMAASGSKQKKQSAEAAAALVLSIEVKRMRRVLDAIEPHLRIR
jgi:hypothetical protein